MTAVTEEELQFLKKWSQMHPRQQVASPMPTTPILQRLLDAKFIRQVVRPDANGTEVQIVTGYELTETGDALLKERF